MELLTSFNFNNNLFLSQYLLKSFTSSITITKNFSKKLSKIIYQTNISNLIILNSLNLFEKIINKLEKNYYKKIQDNILIIFLNCLIISNKTFDDNSFTNKTWSKISKISLKKINKLEFEILQLIGFKIWENDFKKTEFKHWCQCLYNDYKRFIISNSSITHKEVKKTNTRFNSKNPIAHNNNNNNSIQNILTPTVTPKRNQVIYNYPILPVYNNNSNYQNYNTYNPATAPAPICQNNYTVITPPIEYFDSVYQNPLLHSHYYSNQNYYNPSYY